MSLWSDLQKPLIATGESQDTFVAGSQVWFTRGPRKYHATVKGKNAEASVRSGTERYDIEYWVKGTHKKRVEGRSPFRKRSPVHINTIDYAGSNRNRASSGRFLFLVRGAVS